MHLASWPLRIPTRVWAFIGIACALAWFVAVPAYVVPESQRPMMMGICAVLMMFTPLIAAVVVSSRSTGGWRSAFSLMSIKAKPPYRKLLGYLGIAFLGTVSLSVGALAVATWCGLSSLDIQGLSGYRETTTEQITQQLGTGTEAQQAIAAVNDLPSWLILATLAGQTLLGSCVNVIFAFGEEAGWRGWLHTELRAHLSFPTTALFTGVVWGLWHTPLILLGHNYPTLPGLQSVAMMVGFCVLVGLIFTWLREVSGSVWPAALAHGTLNASALLPMALAAPGGEQSTVSVTLLGWTGWVVLAATCAAILLNHPHPHLLASKWGPSRG